MNPSMLLVVAVMTPSILVVESQVTVLVRRARVVLTSDHTLRIVGGLVADPKRQFHVKSRPPEVLVSHLRKLGWELVEVPF